MAEAPITVVHADDHFFFREGVRAFLAHQPDIRLLGSAADGAEALALVARHRPAVLVTDVNMPVMDAHHLVPEVRRRHPATRVVVLTISGEARDVLPLLEAGAAGYLLKDDAGASLADTIRAVAVGRAAITPAVAHLVRADQGSARPAPAPDSPCLTPRECDVLNQLARGLSNAEIAAHLGVSIKTVETHRTALYRKLGVHNAGALIVAALRHRLIAL
ncbi:MAG TPA: response regulator transcription factor [Thermomicrobiales bacterium]|jgi:DNA-binding NarL/FixJ family response regulator